MNLFTRKMHIRGSLRRVPRRRGPDAWEYRYPDRTKPGNPLKAMTFSTADYPTKASMWQHIDTLAWKLNSQTPHNVSQELSFNGVCDRYMQDEHLREISGLKRGQQNTFGGLKISTARGYLQIIENHLRPQWGDTPMTRVTPALVQDWFKALQRSATTKGAHQGCALSPVRKSDALGSCASAAQSDGACRDQRRVQTQKEAERTYA